MIAVNKLRKIFIKTKKLQPIVGMLQLKVKSKQK